jgi:hypothetical protein
MFERDACDALERTPVSFRTEQMRLELDNVIQCLSLNGYLVFSLIDDILACREDERIKLLLEGIERELRDAADICARLLCFDSVPTRVLKYGRVQCTCLTSSAGHNEG